MTERSIQPERSDPVPIPVPYFVRSKAERERWALSVEAARRLESGRLAEHPSLPILARQIYESDIPTG
jgi:hypothetical protein